MNNAKLYKQSNSLQKRDAQEIMEEFSDLLEGKFEEFESKDLLDIGCGAGDVLMETILPKLKNKFIKAVGADISKEMVNYANEKYRNKLVKFLKVDIECDFLGVKSYKKKTNCQLKRESFDFITSFYCLHWIQNQR
jgi:juvenile hormone-III synthase